MANVLNVAQALPPELGDASLSVPTHSDPTTFRDARSALTNENVPALLRSKVKVRVAPTSALPYLRRNRLRILWPLRALSGIR